MRWRLQYHPKSLREKECSPGFLCKQQAERGQEGLCWEGTVCDNKKQESCGHLLQALGSLREVCHVGVQAPGLGRQGPASLPKRSASVLWPLSWAAGGRSLLLSWVAGGRSPGLCSLNRSWEPCSFIPSKSSMALGKSFNLSTSISSTFICEMGQH